MATKKTAKVASKTEKIGLLGGAFNPIHVGHLNSAMIVRSELGLDKIVMIPAFKPPHRDVSGPSAKERLEMVKLAVNPYSPEILCDDLEIERGGVSYTVDTLKVYNQRYSPESLYFIMGADAFLGFQTWKDIGQILKLANLVVTTRPGSDLPLQWKQWPEEIKKHVKSSRLKKITLKTGRHIQFVELKDLDVSSSEIRKRLRAGHDATKMLPSPVYEFIKANKLYERSGPLVKDYRKFAEFCAEKARDKKALALKLYDMTARNSFTDYSIICSGTSTRHTGAIADGIIDAAREEFGLKPVSLEGVRDGHWVLIDFGPVVCHIFEDSTRAIYKIENLWRDCPQILKYENQPSNVQLKDPNLA